MTRTTCFLAVLGMTLAACSESNGDDVASSGGQSGAANGGSGGQGMGGASAGNTNASGGALASGGAASGGEGTALSGGSNSGGKGSGGSNTGGASSGGANSGGTAAGGKSSGGSSSGGANSGGTSSGGKSSSGGAGGAQAGSSGSGGAPASCAPELSGTNRTLVAKAIDDLFVKKDVTAIDRYWADPYLQHNPIAKSGVSTFRSLIGSLVSSTSFQYERLLTLADCELVVVYGKYSQTGVIFDMFRVQGGKIMEHWDSDTGQASDASAVDALDTAGPTAENRAAFTLFAATVLVGGDSAKAADHLTQNFIEHRGAATGPSAFTQFLSGQSYTKVHHVIADGNYVFALSEGKRGSAGFGFYDLFRIDGGKFAEHWDSRRSIPSSTMSGLPIF